ncbi:MAG: protein kinase [Nonomuraea sp.]|nr:protein kinase [Nonomuraea sp.]
MLGAGTTLNDRYVLADRLGGGGMGEVWRADDLVLGRAVAVKVMMPALSENPTFTQRFQNEARAMATLRHRGVVDVYDYGVHEADGRRVSYLVMEYVRGESLDRVLRSGPLGSQAAMRLVAEVADALASAHEQGIVHRDVKPANLMVRPDGHVALTDFGIAHSGSAGHLTVTGTMLGSAAYCAPEMASGGEVTPAVDVYALGVVAYECLTGRLPYQGDTPVQIIFKHLNAPVPELPGELPEAVRRLVARALEKAPEQRWPSASDMARAARASLAEPRPLSAPLAEPGPAAVPAAPAPRTATMTAGGGVTMPSVPAGSGGSRGRRTMTAVLTMAAAVLVSAAVAGSVWLRPAEPSTTDEVFPPAAETTSATSSSSPTRATRHPAPPTQGGASPRPRGSTGVTPSPTPTPTTSSATPTTSPKPTAEPSETSEPEPSQEPTQPGPEEPKPTSEPTVAEPPEDIQCVRAPCP